MAALSVSFTLGKASVPSGANIEHNNREFIANNVDVNRIADNIVYANQDVREAYAELFSESLAAYNATKKQPCRRIHDYFEHIENGNREEPYYEIVVQFGECCTLCNINTPLPHIPTNYAVLTHLTPKFGTVSSSSALTFPTKR
jgi:hypothetical protein